VLIHGTDTPPPPLLPEVPPDLDYVDLFTPLRTEMAALSPDGRRVAYTFRNDGALALVVVESERPAVLQKSVVLLTDREATASLDRSLTTATPARAPWLGWTSAATIVIETNRVQQSQVGTTATANVSTRSSWIGCPGAILAYQPDDGRTRTLVTPDAVALSISRASLAPRERGRILDASQSARVTSHMHDVGWDTPSAEGSSVVSSAPDLILPGIPSVLGFAPDGSNAVMIRSDTVEGVDTYRLDAHTGKKRQTAAFRPDTRTTLLFDPSGSPRIQASLASKSPLEF